MKMSYFHFVLFVLVSAEIVHFTNGIGILSEPPSRSLVANNPQTSLNCGGPAIQYGINAGLCGVCGDAYNGAQDNMANGTFATGVVAKTYTNDGELEVIVNFDPSLKGTFEFRICAHNNFNAPVTQACLDTNLLTIKNDGTAYIVDQASTATITLLLPPSLACSQCVLQWRWVTGLPGTPQPQEFRNCADIALNAGATTTPPATTTVLTTTSTTPTVPTTTPPPTTTTTPPPPPPTTTTTQKPTTTTPWWWWTTTRPTTRWTYRPPTYPPTYAPPRPPGPYGGQYCFRFLMLCEQMVEQPFLTMMCFRECGAMYCGCGFAS